MTWRGVSSLRPLIVTAALALAALAAFLYFFSQERHGNDPRPSSYSRSAVGYNGIAETLSRLGVPIIKSESKSLQKAKGGFLILAEPILEGKRDRTFEALLAAEKVLVVLPKWTGMPDPYWRGWLATVKPLPSTDAQRVLHQFLSTYMVVRPPKVENWSKNELERAPAIDDPVQLIHAKPVRRFFKSDGFKPLIANDEGVLLGEIQKGSRRIWVLSDPDVLSNHGLGKDGKRNAVFAVNLINKLRGDGPVVFDETIHGYSSQPSPWRFLLEFPTAIVTLQGAVALALLLWATLGRFGPPERAAPALATGKGSLIENVARLMAFAGYQRVMVRRYVEATMRDVGYQLHAPKGLSKPELAEWLERVGKARGVSIESKDVLRRAEALAGRGRNFSTPAEIARDIYRWKGEMLHESSGHPRGH